MGATAARRGEPSAVNRAASPSSSRPAPSRSAAPRATKTCSRGASGKHDGVTGVEPGDVQRRTRRVDPHGRVEAGDPGRQRGQPVRVDRRQVVRRTHARLVRQHPHLHEPRRLVGPGGVVALAVPHAGAGRQPLHLAGSDDVRVPLGVLVHQRPGQHPGHDLEVGVRVQVVAAARRDPVVVVRHEHRVPHVGRVVVLPERERVPRRDAGSLGREPRPRPSYVDHGLRLASAREDVSLKTAGGRPRRHARQRDPFEARPTRRRRRPPSRRAGRAWRRTVRGPRRRTPGAG